MELTLKNFKCHDNYHLKIGENGVYLIDGKSGVGKSTILESIAYVLYGGHAPVNINKPNTNPSVKLFLKNYKHYDNILIYRQGKPKLLQFSYGEENKKAEGFKDELEGRSEVYEGDDAQGFINSIFGTKDIWLFSSYIQQGESCSIFSLSQADRFSLLSELLNRGENVDDLIAKVKEKRKETELEMREKESFMKRSKENIIKYSKHFDEHLDNYDEIDDQFIETLRREKNELEKNKILIKQRKEMDEKIALLSSKIFDENEIENKEFILSYDTSSFDTDLTYTSLHDKYQDKNISNSIIDNVLQLRAIENSTKLTIEDIEIFLQNINKLKENKRIEEIKRKLEDYQENTEEEIEKALNYDLKLWKRRNEIKETLKEIYKKLENYDEFSSIYHSEKEIKEEKKKIEQYNFTISKVKIENYTEELIEKLNKAGEIIEQIKSNEAEKQKLLKELDMKTLPEDIDEQIEKLDQIIRIYNESKVVRKCPKCKTPLRIDSDFLVVYEDQISDIDEKQIESHKKLLKVLREKRGKIRNVSETSKKLLEMIPKLNKEELKIGVDNLKKLVYFENVNINIEKECEKFELEKEKTELETELKSIPENVSNNPPKYPLKVLQARAIEKQKLLTELEFVKLDETFDDDYINKYSKLMEINEEKLKQLMEVKKELISLKNLSDLQLREIKKYNDIKKQNCTYLEDNLRDKNLLIETKKRLINNKKLKIELDLLKQNLVDIEIVKESNDYKKYKDIIDKYSLLVQWRDEIKIYEKDEEECKILTNKLGDCEYFLETVSKLLSETLTESAECLNVFINEILEVIFEIPITFNIDMEKEIVSKKITKSNVNFKIFYRNIEYKSVNDLSGGEFSRVSLAVLLAVHRLIGGPILLLDECLSSLHGEMREKLIQLCKGENCISLVVNHETLHGPYDGVFEIK